MHNVFGDRVYWGFSDNNFRKASPRGPLCSAICRAAPFPSPENSKQKVFAGFSAISVNKLNLGTEMDEEGDNQEVPAQGKPEEIDISDEEVDLREVNKIEEILGSSASRKVKMLEFERQMFMDCLYNDGLVICGK